MTTPENDAMLIALMDALLDMTLQRAIKQAFPNACICDQCTAARLNKRVWRMIEWNAETGEVTTREIPIEEIYVMPPPPGQH